MPADINTERICALLSQRNGKPMQLLAAIATIHEVIAVYPHQYGNITYLGTNGSDNLKTEPHSICQGTAVAVGTGVG